MTIANTALLDTLADCLESGVSLVDALERIGTAGGAAGPWAERIRRSVRAELPVAAVLRASSELDDDELSLLAAEGAATVAADLLHAVVLRRCRRRARRRAILGGLVGPFVIGALTVILDPLPALVSGGAYLWPACRGLLVLTVLALALVTGIPALLGRQRLRSSALRLCTTVPGLQSLATLYAEEELTGALAAFIDDGAVKNEGLAAIASFLAWSPLRDPLRIAVSTARPVSAELPMGGLEPLAHYLSLATNLAVVGGVASKRLADRLVRCTETLAALLTARLRLLTRVFAYGLVVLFSITSLVGIISRGLPGMPAIPGVTTSPDQQQLDDLMKQLGQ